MIITRNISFLAHISVITKRLLLANDMPFYEGIGLIAEKNAVVLDFGIAYTKVGYAGESSPRAILPTPALPALNETGQLYEALVAFVHRLYFKHLLVNPRDRRVVLLDPLLGKNTTVFFSFANSFRTYFVFLFRVSCPK